MIRPQLYRTLCYPGSIDPHVDASEGWDPAANAEITGVVFV
jgi:hypothetical protein